ncbi:MAG: HEAT repeat domain-containing protein [Chloroflexi bacterium]|nr:HEAT repeat domain-containing protein [Chloroflexota bacterium]
MDLLKIMDDLERESHDNKHKRLFHYTGRARRDWKDTEKARSDPAIREELLKAAKSRTWTKDLSRSEVFDLLGRLRDPDLFELFTQSLADSDPSVRSSAVWSLAILGDRQAVPRLGKLLREQKTDTDTAEEVARALGKLSCAESEKALVEALGHTQCTVRHAVVNSLKALKATQARDSLQAILARDTCPDVRKAAALALKAIGAVSPEDVRYTVAESSGTRERGRGHGRRPRAIRRRA